MTGASAATGMRAVIVGGSTGIGEGITRALARAGAGVEVIDNDVEGGRALVEDLSSSGARAHFEVADVTQSHSVESARDAVLSRDARVDLVFANAGATVRMPFLESSDDDWRWLFEVNVLGTVRVLRAFLPTMLQRPEPSRVAVTSSLAVVRPTEGMRGQTIYNATKSAQFGLVNALEQEIEGSAVALTTIMPGAVATQLSAKSGRIRAGAPGIQPPAATLATMMSAERAGRVIVAGVLAGARFVTTHRDQGPDVVRYLEPVTAAFDT